MIDSPAQEIKSRLDVVDIIQEYIQTKPAGGYNFKALCPFHNEKTPSFMISRDKQIWHCFGCGKGGDIFTFIQEYEGMTFPEALRYLGEKAGVKIRKFDPKITDQKTKLLDILDLASNYYKNYLLTKQEAEQVKKYLLDRQIKDETIEQFKIGYSPNSWDETNRFLQKNTYKENDIFLAGLLVKKEGSSRFYDRFRNRLMFPIFNTNGSVVGFGARALNDVDQKQAKYINSPQSNIYDKSSVVYGLNFAKQEIKKQDLIVVVEGYMDVISSHQAGITNVVASSGTALAEQQLKLLKRYSSNIALSFDSDDAGQNAAQKGIETALSLGFDVKVITIPNGKDPDECIKQNPEEWKKAINDAEDFMEYYFNKTFKDLDLSQVKNKKYSAKILLPVVKKIEDAVEQNFWIKKIADKLNTDESILKNILKQTPSPAKKETVTKQIINNEKKTREEVLSERLLMIILKHPPTLEIANDHLTAEMINGELNSSLYKHLIIYYTNNHNLKAENINNLNQYINKKTPELAKKYDLLVLLSSKELDEMSSNELKNEGINLIDKIKELYILNKRKKLFTEMQEAEEKGDLKKIEELTKKFNQSI